jgi:hypothetical protein
MKIFSEDLVRDENFGDHDRPLFIIDPIYQPQRTDLISVKRFD